MNVIAHSYQSIAHTEFITKMGGDGLPHQVPVVWYEYIPLTKSTPFAVQQCHTTQKNWLNNVKNQAFRDFLSRLSDKGVIIYQRGLISFLPRANMPSYSTDELNNYFKE